MLGLLQRSNIHEKVGAPTLEMLTLALRPSLGVAVPDGQCLKVQCVKWLV